MKSNQKYGFQSNVGNKGYLHKESPTETDRIVKLSTNMADEINSIKIETYSELIEMNCQRVEFLRGKLSVLNYLYEKYGNDIQKYNKDIPQISLF